MEVNILHFHWHWGKKIVLAYTTKIPKTSLFLRFTEKWSEINLGCTEVNSTCYSLPNKPISCVLYTSFLAEQLIKVNSCEINNQLTGIDGFDATDIDCCHPIDGQSIIYFRVYRKCTIKLLHLSRDAKCSLLLFFSRMKDSANNTLSWDISVNNNDSIF